VKSRKMLEPKLPVCSKSSKGRSLKSDYGWAAGIDPYNALCQLPVMFYAVTMIVAGLSMAIWARPIVDWENRRRAARLSDLLNGGEEKFLEERRSLQTYPVTLSPNMLRMLGCAALIVGLASAVGWGY